MSHLDFFFKPVLKLDSIRPHSLSLCGKEHFAKNLILCSSTEKSNESKEMTEFISYLGKLLQVPHHLFFSVLFIPATRTVKYLTPYKWPMENQRANHAT